MGSPETQTTECLKVGRGYSPEPQLPSQFINAFSIFDFLKPTESESVPVPTATPGVRSVTSPQGAGSFP